MMKNVKRCFQKLSRGNRPLERTRILILLACLLHFIVLSALLLTVYLFQEKNLLLYRIIVLLIMWACSLWLLISGRSWKMVANLFETILTLVVWSNLFFLEPEIIVVNVQYCLIIMLSGFILLEFKRGFFYALLNIVPLVICVVINQYFTYLMPAQQLTINKLTFPIIILLNFSLLLFIAYHFFRSLLRSTEMEARLKDKVESALVDSLSQAAAKTNFLNTMSHELRTPLNAIVGMTNLLLMEDRLPGQQQQLDILKFSADNLMSTINDITDFNKLDNGSVRLSTEEFALGEVLKKISGSFLLAAKEKSVNLTDNFDPDVAGLRVLGDQLRLSQILFHLIGNGIKFTEKGSVQISAEIKYIKEQRVEVRFSVIDTGIGMSDEQQQHVFKPFSAKVARSQRQHHKALGLSIAYQLVKLHGSELKVSSLEGVGSTFQFELTYALPENKHSETEPVQPSATNALSSLRVLVVDDEPLNVMVIKRILAKWGVMATCCDDGQKAVALVTKNDYDLILMDINMPVMDGYEASQTIKEMTDPGKPTIPIIAVTASVGSAVEKVKQFPYIDDCLLKPFRPEDLSAMIQAVVSNTGFRHR